MKYIYPRHPLFIFLHLNLRHYQHPHLAHLLNLLYQQAYFLILNLEFLDEAQAYHRQLHDFLYNRKQLCL